LWQVITTEINELLEIVDDTPVFESALLLAGVAGLRIY